MLFLRVDISRLVVGVKTPFGRSVANRLGYLLMLSKEGYGRIENRKTGEMIIGLLLQSVVGTPR